MFGDYKMRPDFEIDFVLNFAMCSADFTCIDGYVVVNFLSQVIFVFRLVLGMVMYANEIETKEK